MNLIIKGIKELRTPKTFLHKLYGVMLEFVAPAIRNDEFYLKLKWNHCMNYPLDLRHPKTFNEKLQWLKLHDRNSEYIKMVDKAEAKKFVSAIIGDDYIIKTIGLYESTDEIDFSSLPDQFVLKVTHDSGGVVICKDKQHLNIEEAKAVLDKSLRTNYFWKNREWPYKNVKRRIIAEAYLDSGDDELLDYKFMCYNGVCRNLFVCSGRSKHDLRVDFFDTEWNHLPFYRKYPNADFKISKPENLNKMILLANKIASKVQSPFVRIDFYSIHGRIYFGEITFYPGTGMEYFEPIEWDYVFGNYISLNKLLVK